MPKQVIDRTGRRSAPYNLEDSTTTMPAQLYMPLVATAPPDWQISYDHVQNNMMPIQDVMNPLPPTPNHQPPQHSPYLPVDQPQHTQQHHQQHHHQPQQQRSHALHEPPPTPTYPHTQTGPWSTHDDTVLIQAKSSGMPWNMIQERHFPNKSGNACRKRYERLMVKNRKHDWGEERTAKLAIAYKETREQMWSLLADQLEERWDHVEKACMERGVKNILHLASSHSRSNSNQNSKISTGSDNDHYLRDRGEREDSGIAFAGDSSSRRSSHSNGGGTMPTWHQRVLQPSRNG